MVNAVVSKTTEVTLVRVRVPPWAPISCYNRHMEYSSPEPEEENDPCYLPPDVEEAALYHMAVEAEKEGSIGIEESKKLLERLKKRLNQDD